MKIYTESSLSSFEFWSGAETTAEKLINSGVTDEQFDQFIDEVYPDGVDQTDLNDLLRFDDEFVLSYFGVDPEDEEEDDDSETEE